MIEGIFKNMKDIDAFCTDLDNFKVKKRLDYFIVDELKKEAFLSNEAFLDMLT